MTTTNDLIDGLAQRYEEYHAKSILLRQELAEAEKMEQACILLLADIKRTAKPADGIRGLHAHIRPSQIAHCETQIEAWIEIARRSGGFARPVDGAQILLDAGLSKGKRRSLVSSGAKYMIDSDDWERTDAGTYQYVGFAASEGSDHDGQGDEQWPAELYPSGDGDASPHTYRANGATEVAVGRIIA